MVTMIWIFIFGLALFTIGVCVLNENIEYLAGWILSILGVAILALAVFGVAPREIPIGLPANSILNGEYKVAFVYMPGDNVNLGIEKHEDNDKESTERLYLYQFPKSAFGNDSINLQSKKLVVVESGSFKKLVLK